MTMTTYIGTVPIAARLGVTAQTVRNLIRRGELGPAVRVGAQYRIPAEAVEAYLERTLVTA
ncbi:hypothetical protein G9444_0760 [Rhodococcus erythropolis]|uniref:Helix-turn-helix domain-containing protein n=2 Tax=Rhodococcus erythropolis TaxID=1833 RepID=A0A6G9CM62_RHOER|nr:hypothetical protein G9444_0760 [Rhodococcus erythropolis]